MQQQNLPISKITMQANFSKPGQIYEATKKTCAGTPVQLTAWLALAGKKKCMEQCPLNYIQHHLEGNNPNSTRATLTPTWLRVTYYYRNMAGKTDLCACL